MSIDLGYDSEITPPLFDPKVELLKGVLADYELGWTAAVAGGLMTVPEFHAASLRLEFLSQLALGACRGKKRATLKHFDTWLNRQLSASNLALLEDPPEDVFVLGVATHWGGFHIFRGLWEEADHSIQLLLRALDSAPDEISRSWMGPVFGLLRLSDEVVRRSGLRRWQYAKSTSRRPLKLHGLPDIKQLAARVTFTSAELEELGIASEVLEPFMLNETQRAELLLHPGQETVQMRRPLIRQGEQYILTSPSAVSYAVRHFLIVWAQKRGLSESLEATMLKMARDVLFELAGTKSRHGPQFLRLPGQLQGVAGMCRSFVVAIAKHHLLHYLIVGTDLRRLLSSGFTAADELPADEAKQVATHVEEIRKFVASVTDFSAGHTVVVGGLLGQMTPLPDIPEQVGWTVTGTSLGDIAMLLQDPDDPQDRLFYLLSHQYALAEQGYELPNFNGLLNLYQFWLGQGFNLRYSESPHDQPAYVQIDTDYVRTYRLKRRLALDEHVVRLPGEGGFTVVQRANSNASYRSLRDVPAYASIDLARSGELAFYMPIHGGALWIRATAPRDSGARKPAAELWQALQFLLHRAQIQATLRGRLTKSPSEVLLEFTDLTNQQVADGRDDLASGIRIERGETPGTAVVRPDSGFLKNFVGAENQGEVLFLTAVLQAIAELSDGTAVAIPFSDQARAALGGPSAKILHTLRIWNDVDMLLAANPARTYAIPTERISSALRASFTCLPAVEKATKLDAAATTAALNQCVARLVGELQRRLSQFARRPTIEVLLGHNETLLREHDRWRKSARAVRALYGRDEGTQTAQEAEQDRAQLQVTLRALMEAATCECSDSAAAVPDGVHVDELVAMMANIIDLGRNSDVIHFGLASGGMTLHPSGTYGIEAAVLAELAEPFMAHSFSEKFLAAAGNYEQWVRTKAPVAEKADDNMFENPQFLTAWHAEYGMPFDAFRHIAGALQDIAVDRKRVVITCTKEALAQASKAGGATPADVDAFISAFGLPRRAAWPASPPVTAHRDVTPWRFERKLSVSLRPLVLDDDKGTTFTYGLGTARESLAYILDSIQRASFDNNDVFTSTAMRSWLGGRVDELGRKFSESVAARLRELGWQARTELKLTELGAPKKPNLGDVDVLAWHADGRVLAMECKRLKPSRTIAEIARNCDRFKGNVGDMLHKHIRRKDWLQANPDQLTKFCKLGESQLQVRYPLVVNRAVPFKYLSGLPIPPSDVVVDDALSDYLVLPAEVRKA